MSHRSPLLTWGLPIAGLGALTMGSMMVMANAPHRPTELPPRQPPTRPTATDGTLPFTGAIGAIGITEPPGEAVHVASHVAGIIEAVLVAPGDRVEVGTPLFRVDHRAANEEVAYRESERAVREAELNALRGLIPSRRAEVEAARASLAAAEAGVQSASASLADRANALRIALAVDDPRAIAAEEVDRRRFAVETAEAVRAEAEARRSEAAAAIAGAEAALSLLVETDAGAGTERDGPDIVAARSRIERARADYERARVDRDLLTMRSSVEGRVLQVNIRPGEFAPAKELTEGLVVLARSGPMHIRAQIDEVDIARFSPTARAWASPRGAPEARIALSMSRIEPMVVPKRSLSGRTSELVDTRILEVVYTAPADATGLYVGQQMDLYIEAPSTGGGS